MSMPLRDKFLRHTALQMKNGPERASTLTGPLMPPSPGFQLARGALRLFADARLLGIRESPAHVHEAAPLGALHLAAARGVGGEARTGGGGPAAQEGFPLGRAGRPLGPPPRLRSHP